MSLSGRIMSGRSGKLDSFQMTFYTGPGACARGVRGGGALAGVIRAAAGCSETMGLGEQSSCCRGKEGCKGCAAG
eukprot:4131898-Pleurochrysis_carterae.AAC.1